MFEAYKVAVRLSLINHVTPVLGTMALGIHKLGGDVDKLQGKLDKLKLIGMGGAMMAGAGAAGVGMLGKMLEPAKEYAHQLNVINMAGWTHLEQAQAISDAWKNTQTVVTTTATENLRSLLDLKNVLGTMGEARKALPVVSRMQAVLAASSEGQISGNAKELSYSAAKALDTIGAAGNFQEFKKQADMMAKVIIATQGRVTPEMFKSFFVFSRQAAASLDDTFKYTLAPTLMQELASNGGGGGGSKGLGPAVAAFARVTNQGYVNKKALPLLKTLGIIDPDSALKTTTQGTTIGHFKGWQLAAENPFLWATKVFEPAVKRVYGENISKVKMNDIINQAFRGNQGAAWLMSQMINKEQNFLRDQENIRRTMSTDQAYKAAISNDPNTVQTALSAQWTNFKTAFMMGVVPVLIPALIGLTDAFNGMASFFRAHPTLAKTLAISLTAIFSALIFGGAIMMSVAAFRAIGLVFGGLATVAPGIAIAGTAMSKVIGLFNPLSIAAGAAAFGIQQAYQAITTGNSMVYSLLNKLGAAASGDKNWTLGGQVYDWTHKAYDPNAGTRPFQKLGNGGAGVLHINPVARGGGNPDIHTTINLDGRQIANVVSKHQAKSASGPSTGMARFDPTQQLRPVGVSR